MENWLQLSRRATKVDIEAGRTVTDREEQGRTFDVKDAAGQVLEENGAPVQITIAGTYSERYRKARRKVRQENIERRGANSDVETLEDQERRICAESVIGWTGFTANGKLFECTPENVLVVFKLNPWIYDQCVIEQNNHASFLKAPSTT